MCQKREARKEIENFLTYVGGCIGKNRQSPIVVDFTVEKNEEVLEEFTFKVNGEESESER